METLEKEKFSEEQIKELNELLVGMILYLRKEKNIDNKKEIRISEAIVHYTLEIFRYGFDSFKADVKDINNKAVWNYYGTVETEDFIKTVEGSIEIFYEASLLYQTTIPVARAHALTVLEDKKNDKITCAEDRVIINPDGIFGTISRIADTDQVVELSFRGDLVIIDGTVHFPEKTGAFALLSKGLTESEKISDEIKANNREARKQLC